MEYRLSKFKNDIANQFGHNVFYNNVLIRVFYYLLEKRINTRILFLMTTYRRVLALTSGPSSHVCSCAKEVSLEPSPGNCMSRVRENAFHIGTILRAMIHKCGMESNSLPQSINSMQCAILKEIAKNTLPHREGSTVMRPIKTPTQ